VNSQAKVQAKSQPNKKITYVQSQNDIAYILNPKTVQDLENASPYIVKGILKDDAQVKKYTKKLTTKVGTLETTLYQFTVSTLQITKVYKGDIKEGNNIKLGEQYYRVTTGDKESIYYDGNYLPSEVGKEYIFFLTDDKKSKTWAGIYYPMLLERGRYPVLAETKGVQAAKLVDSMTNEELNLGTMDSSDYRALYKQVIDKYMK
jgi:hypothetical protein